MTEGAKCKPRPQWAFPNEVAPIAAQQPANPFAPQGLNPTAPKGKARPKKKSPEKPLAAQSTDESPAGAAIPEKPGKKKKEKTEERAERQYKKVTNDPVVKRESPCVKSESEGENSVKKEIESEKLIFSIIIYITSFAQARNEPDQKK